MTRMAGGLVDIADFAHTATTTPGTAASGFTDSDSYAVRFGPFVVMMLFINSTSAISGTYPNISDVTIYTTSAGWRPPKTMNTTYGNGTMDGEVTLSSAGTVSIRSANGAITAGSNMRMTFVWIDAPA